MIYSPVSVCGTGVKIFSCSLAKSIPWLFISSFCIWPGLGRPFSIQDFSWSTKKPQDPNRLVFCKIICTLNGCIFMALILPWLMEIEITSTTRGTMEKYVIKNGFTFIDEYGLENSKRIDHPLAPVLRKP